MVYYLLQWRGTVIDLCIKRLPSYEETVYIGFKL